MQTETQAKVIASPVLAAFPLEAHTFTVICAGPVHPSATDRSAFRFKGGRAVQSVEVDPKATNRLILRVEPDPLPSFSVETILIQKLSLADGSSVTNVETPRFAGGIYNAMQLKVPHFSAEFPYASTLIDVHVSVACCGGCNGGVHGRGLSVLNSHNGGCFSGIWIHATRSLIDPYPRWQRIVCTGGVVEERNGSMTIVDRGWMTAHRDNEKPHHAPPALPLHAIDVPAELTRSLETKGLDGSYVSFSDITIEKARAIDGGLGQRTGAPVPALEVQFTDESKAKTIAWLYQPSAQSLRPGQRLKRLSGFVHAEEPGRYILLTDKDADVSL
jgi:hypothetical protein